MLSASKPRRVSPNGKVENEISSHFNSLGLRIAVEYEISPSVENSALSINKSHIIHPKLKENLLKAE